MDPDANDEDVFAWARRVVDEHGLKVTSGYRTLGQQAAITSAGMRKLAGVLEGVDADGQRWRLEGVEFFRASGRLEVAPHEMPPIPLSWSREVREGSFTVTGSDFHDLFRRLMDERREAKRQAFLNVLHGRGRRAPVFPVYSSAWWRVLWAWMKWELKGAR